MITPKEIHALFQKEIGLSDWDFTLFRNQYTNWIEVKLIAALQFNENKEQRYENAYMSLGKDTFKLDFDDSVDIEIIDKALRIAAGIEEYTPIEGKDKKVWHSNVCHSCGEPMSNDCPRCTKLWES